MTVSCQFYMGKARFRHSYDMLLPPNLHRRTIYETEVTAVVPGTHRLAGQESISLADLIDEPFITVDSKPSTENTYRIFREQGLDPRMSASVPLVELAKALVGRGLGYSLLMSRPNSTNLTTEGPRNGSTSTGSACRPFLCGCCLARGVRADSPGQSLWTSPPVVWESPPAAKNRSHL